MYVNTKKLGSEYIIINKLSKEAKTAFYVAYNLSSKKIFWNLTYFVCCDKEISILRKATDYEKSQLFDALAKKNKACPLPQEPSCGSCKLACPNAKGSNQNETNSEVAENKGEDK